MPLFSAKLDYALRAVVDLAMQPPTAACQSREIAARQDIRGPYLDQILAVLKREGIVRSIRGAGGGYALARPAARITAAQVVQAVVGDHLLVGGRGSGHENRAASASVTNVVREFEERIELELSTALRNVTVEDLAAEKRRRDESLSLMMDI